MLKIITHPNPILRKKSLPVADVLSEKIQKLIIEMMDTMKQKEGVGLAAPQIGENLRLVVVSHQNRDLILLNPKITWKSFWQEWGEEGCLSIPDKFGEVKRRKKITLEFTNEKNQKQKITMADVMARIIQHELDHLDGVLFIDKARKINNIEY